MANPLLKHLVDSFVDLRSRPQVEQKASATAPAIVGTSVGVAQWPKRDYANFADEGYFKNAIAFRCIQMISQAGAYIPLLLEDKSSHAQIDSHPLLDLLNRPAPDMNGVELTERNLTFFKIAGNAYVESVGPDNKPPRELYSLRPDRVKIVAGRTSLPMAYDYEANGRKITFPVDQLTGKSRLLHLKSMNPLDDWYGMSPMEPAAYSINRHNEAGEHNMALLQNGAVPSGALIFKPVTVEGKSVNAPGTVIDAAEKRLIERYSGSRNAGRPMTLGGNIDWQSFGFSMEELQLIESKQDAAWDTCIAYGVPPILIVPGQSTYNNNREAKLALYEETVIPNMSWYVDHLNNWLVPQFGDNLRLILDLDAIDALSLRREEKRKTYLELFEKRVVDREEFREALDYEPMKDMPRFDSQAHEVTAVVALINGGKLSAETGLKQLASWGVLPKDINYADEKDKITEENGGVDGLTGMDDEIDPITGKPKVPAIAPPANKPQAVKKPAA